MRILTLTPWFPAFPGDQSGSFILDSVTAVAELGHEVKVVVAQPWRPRVAGLFSRDWSRDQLDPSLFPDNLGVEQVQHFSLPRNYLRAFSNSQFRRRVAPALRRCANSFQPGVIHAHTEFPGCVAVQVASELGIPSVVTMHGVNTDPKLNTSQQFAMYRQWLNKADRIVLVGESLAEHYSTVIGRADHFRVVQNGFRLWGGDEQGPAGEWSDQLRLVSLSNLHEGKGVDITLQALKQLLDNGIDNWSYKIVGDGSEREKLEELTDSLGLANRVRFVGACHHHEVSGHLKGCDVFVLPSYREAFGVAYLEAMATGLLAVGVSGQGPDAFIRHDETGLLVQPRSVSSLVGCMQAVFANPQRMQQIASQGRSHVIEQFSMQRHGEQLVESYHEAIGGTA